VRGERRPSNLSSSQNLRNDLGKVGANRLVIASAAALTQKSLQNSIQELGNWECTLVEHCAEKLYLSSF
jgi:hypothetical protein